MPPETATEKPPSDSLVTPVGSSGLGIAALEVPVEDDQTEAPVQDAAAVEPPAPAAAAPAIPGATPSPVAQPHPQIAELQARIAEQERQLQEREFLLRGAANLDEVQRSRTTWQAQGYSEEQIAAGLRNLEGIQTERTQLAQERARLHNLAQRQEMGAKATVATMLSKEYGVPVAEMMKADSPQAMEMLGLKAQLAKLRQSPTPTRPSFADNAPRGAGAASKAQLTERYLATMGRDMSREELRVLFPDRY